MGSLRRTLLFSVQCFLVVTFIFFIFFSESFQEKICPQNYWEHKVQKYQNNVSLNHFRIQELELNLKKEQQNVKYDLEVAKKKALSFNKDPEELTNLAKEQHEKKLTEIHHDLQNFKKDLASSENLLNQAKQKLGSK